MSKKLTNNDKVQLMSQAVKMATTYESHVFDDCFKKMVDLVENPCKPDPVPEDGEIKVVDWEEFFDGRTVTWERAYEAFFARHKAEENGEPIDQEM